MSWVNEDGIRIGSLWRRENLEACLQRRDGKYENVGGGMGRLGPQRLGVNECNWDLLSKEAGTKMTALGMKNRTSGGWLGSGRRGRTGTSSRKRTEVAIFWCDRQTKVSMYEYMQRSIARRHLLVYLPAKISKIPWQSMTSFFSAYLCEGWQSGMADSRLFRW